MLHKAKGNEVRGEKKIHLLGQEY